MPTAAATRTPHPSKVTMGFWALRLLSLKPNPWCKFFNCNFFFFSVFRPCLLVFPHCLCLLHEINGSSLSFFMCSSFSLRFLFALTFFHFPVCIFFDAGRKKEEQRQFWWCRVFFLDILVIVDNVQFCYAFVAFYYKAFFFFYRWDHFGGKRFEKLYKDFLSIKCIACGMAYYIAYTIHGWNGRMIKWL